MDSPTKRTKERLFEKLKAKGLFWSYSLGICYDESKDDLLIETTLKYADMDDIKMLFKVYGKQRVRQLWEKQLRNDSRFKKLNYFLARVFFGMNVEAQDFAGVKNDRAEKLRLLAGSD
jgi:putative transposase